MTTRRSTDPLILALAAGIREIAARRARGVLPPTSPHVATRVRLEEHEQVAMVSELVKAGDEPEPPAT